MGAAGRLRALERLDQDRLRCRVRADLGIDPSHVDAIRLPDGFQFGPTAAQTMPDARLFQLESLSEREQHIRGVGFRIDGNSQETDRFL